MTIDEYSCIMVGCLALRSVANRSRKCDVHIYIYIYVCVCVYDELYERWDFSLSLSLCASRVVWNGIRYDDDK